MQTLPEFLCKKTIFENMVDFSGSCEQIGEVFGEIQVVNSNIFLVLITG